jgi:hypothetical protein
MEAAKAQKLGCRAIGKRKYIAAFEWNITWKCCHKPEGVSVLLTNQHVSSSLISMTWIIKYLWLSDANGTVSHEISKFVRNRILQNLLFQSCLI